MRVVLEVVVRVNHLQNHITIPAKLGLTKCTQHFIAAIMLLNLEGALGIRACLGALAHEI
jgi:hypothetical protein